MKNLPQLLQAAAIAVLALCLLPQAALADCGGNSCGTFGSCLERFFCSTRQDCGSFDNGYQGLFEQLMGQLQQYQSGQAAGGFQEAAQPQQTADKQPQAKPSDTVQQTSPWPQSDVTRQAVDQNAAAAQDAAADYDSQAQEVLNLVNQERSKAGLSPLTLDNTLNSVADVRAQEVCSSFSHTRPNGGSYDDLLRTSGLTYSTSGENIARGQQSASEVVTDWLNSPGHRANILNPSYTKMGLGLYNGSCWAQIFSN